MTSENQPLLFGDLNPMAELGADLILEAMKNNMNYRSHASLINNFYTTIAGNTLIPHSTKSDMLDHLKNCYKQHLSKIVKKDISIFVDDQQDFHHDLKIIARNHFS